MTRIYQTAGGQPGGMSGGMPNDNDMRGGEMPAGAPYAADYDLD